MANEALPIWSIMDTLLACLSQRRNVIVAAPTGSGKSTQVPQALYRAGYADRGAIFVCQPRRIACRAVAQRVAYELGVKVGEEVGYWVKEDKCTSVKTKLCFVTDGMLLRLIQSDRILATSSVIVFDEFHERRIPSDVALALTRVSQALRPDLRIIVMSATLDPGPVAAYLDADKLEASGRAFEVVTEYVDRGPDLNSLDAVAARAVSRICEEKPEGDILVFLPGKLVIDECLLRLEKLELPGVTPIALFGELTKTEQDRALGPVEGRKVILATNIAETSLTIPGVSIVIDGGYERRIDFDPETGANRMSTSRITLASANQRAGRAGREQPGYCLRLWSVAEQKGLEPFLIPEIRRKDIGDVILSLKAAGVKYPENFPLLESPSPAQFEASNKLLRLLGALNSEGELTEIGWRMTQMPAALAPRYARMVVEAERSRCVHEVAIVAALMSGKPVETIPIRERLLAYRTLADFATDTSSDFYTLLEIFKQAKEAEFHPSWCREHYVNAEALRQANRLVSQIVAACSAHGSTLGPRRGASREQLVRCFATGMPDRLAMREKGEHYRLCSGPSVKLHRGTAVTNRKFVLAGRILFIARDEADGDIGRISDLTAVELPLLEELFPQLFKRSHAVLGWNAKRKTANVSIGRNYGSLTLDAEAGSVNRDTAIDLIRLEALEVSEIGWRRTLVRQDAKRRTVAVVDGEEILVQGEVLVTDGPCWTTVYEEGGRKFATLQRRIVEIAEAEVASEMEIRPSLKAALDKLLGE